MWCSTVRGERDSRAAISALRQPAATSSSTSSSRAVRPAALRRVARERAARHRADAGAAHAAAHALGERRGAEPVEHRQRRALRRLVAVGERPRLLVRAAQRVPRRGRVLPAAFDLQPERRRAAVERARIERRRASARTPARRRTRGGAFAPPARWTRSASAPTASLRPSSQAASARAAATGASRCSVFERSGEVERLVEHLERRRDRRGGCAGGRARPGRRRGWSCPPASLGDDRVGALAGELPAAAVDVAQRLPAFHVAGEAVEVVARARRRCPRPGSARRRRRRAPRPRRWRSSRRHRRRRRRRRRARARSPGSSAHVGSRARSRRTSAPRRPSCRRRRAVGAVVAALGQRRSPASPQRMASSRSRLSMRRYDSVAYARARCRPGGIDSTSAIARWLVASASALRRARTSANACAASASRLAPAIAAPREQLDRLVARRDRGVEVVELEAVRRVVVEQRRARRVVETIGMGEGGAAMRRRFLARAAHAGLARRLRRPAQRPRRHRRRGCA